MGTTEGIELLGGMGRALAERDRNIERFSRVIEAPGDSRFEVKHKRGSEWLHLWVDETWSDRKAYTLSTLTPTQARTLAVALRTAASRIDSGDTGRTAR